MELTILGSGTAVPSLRRGAAGYLVRVGSDLVVMDTGPGTLSRLLKAGVGHNEVTHLLYSHNHLDHTGELTSWLFASRIPASARTGPLTICGSAGFMQMLDSLDETYGHWIGTPGYSRNLVTLGGDAASHVDHDGWTLTASAVRHIDSSLAYRITDAEGRSLVYSGDTDVCDELIALAHDADLLLVEASFPDAQKVEGHLTPSEAGEIARRSGARRVVLTHFYPPCDEADMLGELRRTYDGEAFLAEDGMRLTV